MLREKVTKLAKIMFTGLTMALCVTALNPAVTAKAEDMLQESRAKWQSGHCKSASTEYLDERRTK